MYENLAIIDAWFALVIRCRNCDELSFIKLLFLELSSLLRVGSQLFIDCNTF